MGFLHMPHWVEFCIVLSAVWFSLPSRWKQACGLFVLFLVYDSCQINYLKIYQIGLCHIFGVGRTVAIDDQTEVMWVLQAASGTARQANVVLCHASSLVSFGFFLLQCFFCLHACVTGFCAYFDEKSSQYFHVVMVSRCYVGYVSLWFMLFIHSVAKKVYHPTQPSTIS